MIVSQEVFEWLEKIGMIAGGRETAHGQVELPREAAEGIMSGRLMASIMLKALGNKQPLMKDQNSIQNLRNVSMQQQPNDNHQLAASERLYVWNILSSLLNRIKISISGDEKSLIIAGDEDIAVGLLLEIMKKSSEGKGKGAVSPNNSRPQKRNLNIMQQIDDDAKTKIQDVHQPQRPMKPDDRSNRPPVSGGNSHKSTPAQGYRPVPRLNLHDAIQILVEPGQILRELESKILVTLKSNSDLQKEIREMGGGAISTFLDAFRKHRDMISRGLIITLLLSLARANIRALFAVELPARLLDDAENLNVLSAILKYIANDPSSHEVFVKGGGLIEMLQFIQRESPASRPRSNRIAAITILATFWVGFLNDLASIQGLQDKLWITLRTLLPQPDPASSDLEKKNENNLNNGSIGQTATSAEDLQSAFSANQALLQLLSGFIDARSSNSSLAYKLVVQALLTWYSNTEMRKLIQTHLGNILQSTPRMPLSILIEPYMKKVQSHGVSDFDHSFLSILSRHPRTYESVQDFVKRLVKLCLSVALMGSKVLKEMNIEIHRKEQPRLETRLHTVIKSKEELDPAIASLFQELGALIGLLVQRSVQAPIVKNMKEGVKNEPPRYIHSAESDDSVLLSDVDSPRKEAYTILSSERSSRSEKHPAMVPQPNPNVVLHPPKDRIREPKLNRENSRPELQMQEDLKQPQPPQAPSQKISAAERRAANLERAKKLEEERKKAIISKREDQDDRKAKKLPNVLTKDEVLSQVAKKEKKSLVPGRPSSVLRGRGGRDSRSSMSDGNSDDDRMSLPPPEGPLQRLMRPTSPKTKKREAEIAEIKRKREMRLQMQKEQAEMARARERELFLKARMEVEQRMAVLKKARGELLPSESFLDEERGEGSFMDDSPTRESNTAPRFNLREHAKHFTSNSRFDLERHVFMWKNEPRRRETVQTVLRILEEIFVEVTTDRSESSLALPRKGVRLRRNGEEMGSRQSDGQENSSHRLHREDSSTSRNRDSSSFDNFDKYLLSKSSMTNDEQLKKMYRRQAYLRRKLSKYREEKALQEAQRLRDEAVIKKAMEQEKRRQRENEAQRRAKLKEKIAAYKQKLEEERKEYLRSKKSGNDLKGNPKGDDRGVQHARQESASKQRSAR
ncbi:hypothetical protein GUITHDRAFT_161228, partial [Guillardia theta CCMP2712]